ncbi:tetratricopeptide repeat protein [Lancefieldella sp. Marseille-Q7238]|uniref:tetratricopeptide repeat protein n=1 Tax=Lancefieldella sp. Marseille-Q7238 TaxID=3022127 RepID=UPI0024A8FA6F|nr:tetratricopeptide repeat protein [Lancefieldella sp. Marseille-Q7238]
MNGKDVLDEIDEALKFHADSKDNDAAISLMRRKLCEIGREYGEKSSEFISVLNELGSIERDAGLLDESASDLLRAVEIQMDAIPIFQDDDGCMSAGCTACSSVKTMLTKHIDPGLAATLCSLGGTYRLMGDFGQAEYAFIMAIQIYDATVGTKHPLYATVLNELALLRQNQGRYGEAIELHDRVRAIIGMSAHAEYRANNLFNRALCEYLRRGDFGRAYHDAKEALVLYTVHMGADSLQACRARKIYELISESYVH